MNAESVPNRPSFVMRTRRHRRGAVAVLAVLGGVLMLLSPSVRTGLLVFALGVVLELVGVALERRDRR